MKSKPTRKRNKIISFRVTEAEKEIISQKIKKSKLSNQEYFLKLISEKEVKPEEKTIKIFAPKIVQELNRIGINLNQIAKKLNTKEKIGLLKKIDLNKELYNRLQDLYKVIDEIRKTFKS